MDRAARLVGIVALLVAAAAAVGLATHRQDAGVAGGGLMVDPEFAGEVLFSIAAGLVAVRLWTLIRLRRGRLRLAGDAPPSGRLSDVVRVAVAVTVVLGLFVGALVLARLDRSPNAPAAPAGPPALPADSRTVSVNGADVLLPLAIAAATVLVAVAWRSRPRRSLELTFAPPESAPPGEPPAEARSEVLDEGLDALLAERDPRRAVVAAYVAMERAMARRGWARRSHEAPMEYVARVLGFVPGRAADMDRLAELYEIARFSVHPVTPSMHAQAVDAVRRLRAEVTPA